VLKALGDDAQRESLNTCNRLIPVLGVTHDAWERWYFGQPPAVALAFELDREGHLRTVLSGRLANKRLHTSAAGVRTR
jgi:hypothetical protein